jgi:hypothetical protein
MQRGVSDGAVEERRIKKMGNGKRRAESVM